MISFRRNYHTTVYVTKTAVVVFHISALFAVVVEEFSAKNIAFINFMVLQTHCGNPFIGMVRN